MADYSALIKQILELKKHILEIDEKNIKLSETDTRQGLINPLFRALGWDFSDFESIKSEYRGKYNEPVDYAFFSTKNGDIPILLLEAKQYGKNLDDTKTVKQLCTYLGEMGTQWGVISDGNYYIMYNSRGGLQFGDQKYLSLQLKMVDTNNGITVQMLAEKLYALLSRQALESETIQSAYKEHIIHSRIERAFESVLAEPFTRLSKAIKAEFKQLEGAESPPTDKQVKEYLTSIADEGRIMIEHEGKEIHSVDEMLRSVTVTSFDSRGKDNEEKVGAISYGKRITVSNLLDEKLINEGDKWKMVYKGDTYWGVITGNGEIEVGEVAFQTPSKAGGKIMVGSCSGWFWWFYETDQNGWARIDVLREQCRKIQSQRIGR